MYRYAWFDAAGNAGNVENRNVDGVAMVKYHGNTGLTSVTVVIRGLQGNSTYGVMVGDAFVDVNALNTNVRGVAQYAVEFPFPPFPENPAIQIFKYDGDPDFVWEVSQDELRAVGVPL